MTRTNRIGRKRAFLFGAAALLIGAVGYVIATGERNLTGLADAAKTDARRALGAARRAASDWSTTAKVRTALSLSSSVADFDLDVGSRGGTVTLSGNVSSPEARAEVVRIVRDVPGIVDVIDELVPIVPETSDEGLPRRIIDVETEARVYRALLRAPGCDFAGLEVFARDQVVRLRGQVGDDYARGRAEAIAGAVPGVRSVVDETVTVDLFPRTTAIPLPDEELAQRVRTELSEAGAIAVEGIRIEVSSGVVHLSGSVRSEAEKQLAEMLAGAVVGVVAIENAMAVQ